MRPDGVGKVFKRNEGIPGCNDQDESGHFCAFDHSEVEDSDNLPTDWARQFWRGGEMFRNPIAESCDIFTRSKKRLMRFGRQFFQYPIGALRNSAGRMERGLVQSS